MFLQDVNNTIKAAGGFVAEHNQTIEVNEYFDFSCCLGGPRMEP